MLKNIDLLNFSSFLKPLAIIWPFLLSLMTSFEIWGMEAAVPQYDFYPSGIWVEKLDHPFKKVHEDMARIEAAQQRKDWKKLGRESKHTDCFALGELRFYNIVNGKPEEVVGSDPIVAQYHTAGGTLRDTCKEVFVNGMYPAIGPAIGEDNKLWLWFYMVKERRRIDRIFCSPPPKDESNIKKFTEGKWLPHYSYLSQLDAEKGVFFFFDQLVFKEDPFSKYRSRFEKAEYAILHLHTSLDSCWNCQMNFSALLKLWAGFLRDEEGIENCKLVGMISSRCEYQFKEKAREDKEKFKKDDTPLIMVQELFLTTKFFDIHTHRSMRKLCAVKYAQLWDRENRNTLPQDYKKKINDAKGLVGILTNPMTRRDGWQRAAESLINILKALAPEIKWWEERIKKLNETWSNAPNKRQGDIILTNFKNFINDCLDIIKQTPEIIKERKRNKKSRQIREDTRLNSFVHYKTPVSASLLEACSEHQIIIQASVAPTIYAPTDDEVCEDIVNELVDRSIREAIRAVSDVLAVSPHPPPPGEKKKSFLEALTGGESKGDH